MTKITADPQLRAKLHGFQDLIEVCDENGQVVGFFHPVSQTSGPSRSQTSSPVSDSEIEECRKQQTGRLLADIFADLERQA
jgi:hypothetical protein